MEKGRIIGGKYRIREALGRGGGGTVYLAEDLRVGTLRAVKRGGRGNAGVFREGEILKKLEHPALPGIVDRLEEEDGVFLVMEYIPGRNLEACLKSHGPFESDRVRAWALELCGILSYLHRQEPPVLYRDLKPSNLILDREGRLHLVDFGIAAEAGETFTPAGSRGYAAPEQFRRGEAQQASTDLYALGVTLYRLAAGRLPEPGKEPRRPGGMSRGMFRVLKKCMRADPEKRFRNCRDFQKAMPGRADQRKKVPERSPQNPSGRGGGSAGVGRRGPGDPQRKQDRLSGAAGGVPGGRPLYAGGRSAASGKTGTDPGGPAKLPGIQVSGLRDRSIVPGMLHLRRRRRKGKPHGPCSRRGALVPARAGRPGGVDHPGGTVSGGGGFLSEAGRRGGTVHRRGRRLRIGAYHL